MSFIKHSVPPPEVKEGEVLQAEIVDIQYPVKGQYREQVKWRVRLEGEGYETTIWMAYYKEPSDRSILGQLCISYMNMAGKSFNSVSDALEAIRKHGKVYVKCSGFREWQEKLYPNFKVVATKLPPLQRSIESNTSAEKPNVYAEEYKSYLTPDFYKLPKDQQEKILKKLRMQQPSPGASATT